MEQELQLAVDREVIVMSGSEANGYAEMTFGCAQQYRTEGLVIMVQLGKGIGVAMFDGGVLVRNVDLATQANTWTWNLGMWADAGLPPADTPAGSPDWARWAERCESYLSRLDTLFSPDMIVIGGTSIRNARAEKWVPLVQPRIRAPVVASTLGSQAGILGSAAGCRVQLELRDDLSRVRAAIGKTTGVSPQLLGAAELRKVFDSFDTDGSGSISADELSQALRALGVQLPEIEVRELFTEVAGDNGEISFADFDSWWKDFVAASPVTYLHTEAEFDAVMAEEATSGRLVVLEVGFSYCKPCKKFEPGAHAAAPRSRPAQPRRAEARAPPAAAMIRSVQAVRDALPGGALPARERQRERGHGAPGARPAGRALQPQLLHLPQRRAGAPPHGRQGGEVRGGAKTGGPAGVAARRCAVLTPPRPPSARFPPVAMQAMQKFFPAKYTALP